MTFYLVDKKAGVTSHDVVKEIQHKFNLKKSGHAGTLDPFATGLLVVASNEDTKLLEFIFEKNKTYTGVISFGTFTDTHDVEGKVIAEKKRFKLSIEELEKLINQKYVGKILQTPPQHSSIKINGKKAYEYARNGEEIELKAVPRTVYSFEVKLIDKTNVWFRTDVSTGTYIRALVRDISNDLGIPAHLKELRREKIGNFSVPKNNEIIALERKQVLNITETHIDKATMKSALEGKIVNLSYEDDYVIVENGDDVVMMERQQLYKYKIKKRIK